MDPLSRKLIKSHEKTFAEAIFSVHFQSEFWAVWVVCEKVPNTSQNFPCMQDSEELVFRRGFVEVGRFFIDKECIGYPNQINVFSTHHQLFEPLTSLEW